MDIFGNFSRLKGDKEVRKVNQPVDLDFSYSEIIVEPVAKIESKSSSSFNFAKIMIIAIFTILGFRLFLIQVTEGERYAGKAEENRIRPRLIEATRGLITDNSGLWLARNKPSFALAVFPSDLPKNKVERANIYSKLAELSGLPVDEIRGDAERNSLSSLDEVLIKENISHEDALLLEEAIAGLPGVYVAKKPIREYRGSLALSHMLGYTGLVSGNDLQNYPNYYLSDRIGKIGLESSYEKYLKGIHGVEQVEVDSRGNIVKVLVKEESKEPIPGNDLVLYLDADLQAKTAEALSRGIQFGREFTKDEKVVGGVAIVMDVRSGGILSMVSLPDYENNLFATKIAKEDYQKLILDKSNPMFNRAVSGTYPPGSISKIIMAAAGLSEHVIGKNTAFDTPAEIKIGEYIFPDWKDHGYTNIVRAIAESNNIFFYALGGGYDQIKGMGVAKMKQYWEMFGLGAQTGIDIPGEASGLLPDVEWKKRVKNEPWYLGDSYHVAIGQGDLLVTPIQMLRATAVIANGGKLLEPQLVKKILGADGTVIKEFGPQIEREGFLSSDVIRTVGEGMRMAVTEGSARNLNDLPVDVAGKTGTAQFLNNQKTHAWFECYAPYDNPEIAIIVMVEGGGGGHEIAAPVAKDILSYYFSPERK